MDPKEGLRARKTHVEFPPNPQGGDLKQVEEHGILLGGCAERGIVLPGRERAGDKGHMPDNKRQDDEDKGAGGLGREIYVGVQGQPHPLVKACSMAVAVHEGFAVQQGDGRVHEELQPER